MKEISIALNKKGVNHMAVYGEKVHIDLEDNIDSREAKR